MTSQPPARRWFQFRLRTLLIVIALLAVPMAWVGYSLNWIRQREALLGSGMIARFSTPAAPPQFLRWPFRETGIFRIMLAKNISDADRDKIRQAFPEAGLYDYGSHAYSGD